MNHQIKRKQFFKNQNYDKHKMQYALSQKSSGVNGFCGNQQSYKNNFVRKSPYFVNQNENILQNMYTYAKQQFLYACGIDKKTLLLFFKKEPNLFKVFNFIKNMVLNRLLMAKVDTPNKVLELRKNKDLFLVFHIASIDKKIGSTVDLDVSEKVMHKSAHDSKSSLIGFLGSSLIHKFINFKDSANEHVVRAHIQGNVDSPYVGLKSGMNSVHNLSKKIGETESLCAVRLSSVSEKDLLNLKYCSVSNTFLVPKDFMGGRFKVTNFIDVPRLHFSRVDYHTILLQGLGTLAIGMLLTFSLTSIAYLLNELIMFYIIISLLKHVPWFRIIYAIYLRFLGCKEKVLDSLKSKVKEKFHSAQDSFVNIIFG